MQQNTQSLQLQTNNKIISNDKFSANESKYFSILKAILIYAVVFAHLIACYYPNDVFGVMLSFIYTFHMPLFVFSTGVFGKFSLRRFFGALLVYVVFSGLRIGLNVAVGAEPNNMPFIDVLNKFIHPQYTLWYMLAYSVWLLTTLFIKKVKIWHILLSFAISLGLGFAPFINTFLSASRIFYFLPFFMIGRYVRQNKDKFFEILSKAQNLTTKLICAFTLVFVIVFFVLTKDVLDYSWLFGNSPYQDNKTGLLLRFAGFSISIISSLALVLILPYKTEGGYKTKFMVKTESLVEYVGKNTLSVYLLHTFLIAVFDEFTHDFLLNNVALLVLSVIILPIALCLVLSIKYISKPIGFLANPVIKKKPKLR